MTSRNTSTYVWLLLLSCVGYTAAASAQNPYAIESWDCTPGYPDCQDNVGPTLTPVAGVTISATCYNSTELYQQMVLGTKIPCQSPVIAELNASLSSFETYEDVDGCPTVIEVGEVVATGKVTMVASPYTEFYVGSGTEDCEGGVSDPPPWESGC